MDHKSQDSHLCGTAVVQFDGTLLVLDFRAELVPSKVEGTIAEVSWEFSSSGNVLHDEKLQPANEGKDLEGTGNWNTNRRGPTVTKIRELGSGVIDVTWEVDTGLVGQVTNDGKHGDTSVLEFDVSETIETFLVGLREESKWVPVSEWLLDTDLVLEGLDGSAGGSLLGRGEGGSSGDKGGGDDGLHGVQRKISTSLL